MKKFLSIAFICIFSISLAMAEEITLAIGQQKVLDGTNVSSVSAGDPKVVSISIPKDQAKILLKAANVGTTTITLINTDGSTSNIVVNVIAKDPNKIMDEVNSLLGDIEGVELKVVGNRVIIDGQILTENDNKRIDKVIALYGEQVVKFAEFNQAYLPQEDNIVVEFNVVEVANDNTGDYGINWNKALQGAAVNYEYSRDLSAGAVLGSTLGIVSNFAGALSVMTGTGHAKVHDTHKVITIAGKAAKYFAGGEFGVQQTTSDTSTVQWKEYGTAFDVTPEIDVLGNMRISIESEVSELSGMMVDGIPALKKNNISTSVRIKEGQTIALGGYIKRVNQEDVSRVPGLGNIPVLGALFSSKQYQKGQTDGVIFITAKRISAEDNEMKEMIDQPLEKFRQEKKKWYQRDKK